MDNKSINELYAIIFGTTYGEPKITETEEVVGIDPDTGEDVYETFNDISTTYDPHEKLIETFTDGDEAIIKYRELVSEYEKSHRYPWDDGHVEILDNDYKTEFTDGEDSEWYSLRSFQFNTKEP